MTQGAGSWKDGIRIEGNSTDCLNQLVLQGAGDPETAGTAGGSTEFTFDVTGTDDVTLTIDAVIDGTNQDATLNLFQNTSVGTGTKALVVYGNIATSGGFINVGAEIELTIATGVITVTRTSHTVDTEGDAASDDLDTINGGSAGDIIYLRAASSARTVVIKNLTGNIVCGADFSLTSGNDSIMLVKRSTTWIMHSKADNAA